MRTRKFYVRAAKWVIGCTLLGSLAVYSCKKAEEPLAVPEAEAPDRKVQQTAIPDQYIVSAEGGNVSLELINAKLKKNGHAQVSAGQAKHLDGLIPAEILRLTKEQYQALRGHPDILIEEDHLTSLSITSTGGSFAISGQYIPWGVRRVKGPVSAVGKRVWLIDSGVELDHPDLTVDQVLSKSVLSSAAGGNWSSPTDEYGHGTNVAGVIAARSNAIGVVGVAAGATVVSVKALNYAGSGASSDLVSALSYVSQKAKAGDVCNISIAAYPSKTIDSYVKKLATKGIYVTIAAGNNSADCNMYSPQRLNAPRVFTVSGMDSFDVWLVNSNYGSSIDYCAPAKFVTSTAMGKLYKNVGGTSMAAPHLAGVLLATNGRPVFTTYVKNDPDFRPDPIAQSK